MNEYRNLLRRIADFASENYPIQMLGLVAEINVLLNRPLPEPDYWHVVDEDGNSIYSASHKQACHDHINDLLEKEFELATEISNWRVEGLYKKPLL